MKRIKLEDKFTDIIFNYSDYVPELVKFVHNNYKRFRKMRLMRLGCGLSMGLISR